MLQNARPLSLRAYRRRKHLVGILKCLIKGYCCSTFSHPVCQCVHQSLLQHSRKTRSDEITKSQSTDSVHSLLRFHKTHLRDGIHRVPWSVVRLLLGGRVFISAFAPAHAAHKIEFSNLESIEKKTRSREATCSLTATTHFVLDSRRLLS